MKKNKGGSIINEDKIKGTLIYSQPRSILYLRKFSPILLSVIMIFLILSLNIIQPINFVQYFEGSILLIIANIIFFSIMIIILYRWHRFLFSKQLKLWSNGIQIPYIHEPKIQNNFIHYKKIKEVKILANKIEPTLLGGLLIIFSIGVLRNKNKKFRRNARGYRTVYSASNFLENEFITFIDAYDIVDEDYPILLEQLLINKKISHKEYINADELTLPTLIL